MNARLIFSLLLLAVCCLLLGFGTGCTGLDADNTNSRSWNEPRGFDQSQGFRDPTRARY